MKKYVFGAKENARKRVLILTPIYITVSIYSMVAFTFTKIYFYQLRLNDETYLTAIYAVSMATLPPVLLFISRFYMLRKARTYMQVKLKKNQKLVNTTELGRATSPSQAAMMRRMSSNTLGWHRRNTLSSTLDNTAMDSEEEGFKIEHKYCTDFMNALKIWDNQPIIDAYFDSTNKIYNEQELKDIKRLKKKRVARRRSMMEEELQELNELNKE